MKAALQAGLQRMDLALSDAQQDQLLAYLQLLGQWNRAYNLTAIRDPREQLVVHLFDCLAVLPVLQADLGAGRVVVDVGSGGGLPGVIIAIAYPQVEVHTIDAVAKKAAFVTQVRGTLKLANVHAHHARVEALKPPRDLPFADLIVSRAFASLADFVRLTQPLLAAHGRWAALKGQVPTDEISALPATVEVSAIVPVDVPELEAQRHVVWIAPRGTPKRGSA